MKYIITYFVMSLFFAVGLATVNSAIAGQASEKPSVGMTDNSETLTPVDADALMARAQEMGEIKIIVGVKASFTVEGSLDREGVEKQRNGIAAAQQQLLDALENPISVRKFETVPYIAITVTPSDLTRIMNAPDVTSIKEDIAVAPAGNFYNTTKKPSEHVICRSDARICPDGSSVSRTAPNCAFAECP